MPEGQEAEKRDSDPLVGTVIADRYRVDARLGEGGMGTVYRVEHTHMRKKLALKVLHRELSTYDEVVARFEREAMAAANIEHPNVANATDFGKLADGSFYLVLEYVEGIDLRTILQRERFLNPARCVHIALQVLGALGRAHELGIVHRDLKPENVLLVEKDGDPEFVKVLDFGIARVPVGSLGSPSRSGGGDMRPLTKAGTVYGTPEYMAPEQALGHQVDGRADLYAVGILMFEMLCGARPFDDKDKIALLGAHVSKPIPRIGDRAPKDQFVPEGLEAVVRKLLAKTVEERYQTAREVGEALLELGYEAPMPITRHPSGRSESQSRIPLSSSESRRVELQGPDSKKTRTQSGPGAPASTNASPSAKATTAAPLPSAEPRRASKVPWIIAATSVAVAIAAVVALRTPPSAPSPSTPATSPSPPPAPTTTVSAAASVDLKELALRALGRVASGEIEGGLKELESLAAANPNDAAVLRGLAQGYAKAKRLPDAVAALRKLTAVSNEAATDALLVPVYEEALADAKAGDDAVALLLGSAAGTKILHDLAFAEKGNAAAKARALRALRDPKNKQVPASLRAAVELRVATTCPAKRAVLEKHRKDFDQETLPLLQQLGKPTCGPAKKSDCWPCLADLLPKVIKEVEKKK